MSEPTVSQITVEFERRVSDGDYGSELFRAQLIVDLDGGVAPDDATFQLGEALTALRAEVTRELGRSPNIRIRRQINPPPRICGICKQPLADDENYEHEACREQRAEQLRLERAARQAAEDDDDDEDLPL